MNNDEDSRKRPVFSPGVSKSQIQRAEQMLGDCALKPYLEKRCLAGDYRPGTLERMDKIADPVEVMISIRPLSDSNCHVLLTDEPLPDIRYAEVAWKRANVFRSVTGRVDASRPGRRQEDHIEGKTVMVSFLHPK